MIWSYCPIDRQDDRMTGFWGHPQDSKAVFRILRSYTVRMTRFMVILEIDPPYLVTLVTWRASSFWPWHQASSGAPFLP